MFVAVHSEEPAACQSAPERFRDIRGSLLDTWTPEMLAAYCADLEIATGQRRNLLAEKYARMDERIPALAEDPAIDFILAIECAWQDEIRRSFPRLYQRCCRSTVETGDGREFSVYLRAELETYGFETRQLYFLNVKTAERNRRNLGIEALRRLVARFGFEGLEQAERDMAAVNSQPIETGAWTLR